MAKLTNPAGELPDYGIKLFRFGENLMQPGERFIPDAARLEIWFGLSGAATATVDGRGFLFEAGQGILIQSASIYGYQASGRAPHMLAWCESEPLPSLVLPDFTQRPFPITPMMTMLVDLGLAAERKLGPVRDALTLHVGRALLVEVLAQLENGDGRSGVSNTVERLRTLIATDPRQDWTLGRMARALAMSPRTLTRKLSLDGSPSPGEVLWRARVRRGAELLVRSRASCADIADLCGFQSPAHFSRRIRETTGMTPVDIRRWAIAASFSERADFFRGIETGERGVVSERATE